MKQILFVLCVVTAHGYSQSPEAAAISGAADALGGKARIKALRTLVIEGAGIDPNVGQNRNPDDPLPNWKVTDYRKTIDLAEGRMRLQQRRVAEFAFSMANDVRQDLRLDGDVAFNVGPGTRMARVNEIGTRDRRYEMLGDPVTIVRAALDPAAKLSHLRKEGKVDLIDIITAKGDPV